VQNWLQLKRDYSAAPQTSAGSDLDQRKAFLARSIGEPVVKRDEIERRRTAFRRDEGSGELQRTGCAQRVNAQKSDGIL